MSEKTWLDWRGLEASFREAVTADFASWISPDQPHHAAQLMFAHSRLGQGRDVVESFSFIEGLREGPIRCVDVGGGNGGVALGIANARRVSLDTIDRTPNVTMSKVFRATGLPIRRTIGEVSALPYESGSFDAVLMIDVVEHVRDRRRMGAEVMRVLKPGGVCFITTPARLRYFWRPDPHYGVRGLVIFPNGLQRLVVNRLLKRRVLGANRAPLPAYDVEHTFWHVDELARLFPGRASVEPLFGFPLQGGSVFTREGLRMLLRKFVFHHVVIWKARLRGSSVKG